jgi:hypothetical protein
MVRVQTNCSFYRNDGKGAGSFSVGLRLFLISMILLGMSHSISAGCAQAVDYVDLSYRLCSRIRCHQFIKRLNSLIKQRSPKCFICVVSVFSTSCSCSSVEAPCWYHRSDRLSPFCCEGNLHVPGGTLCCSLREDPTT